MRVEFTTTNSRVRTPAMGCMEFRGFLDFRFIQYRTSSEHTIVGLRIDSPQNTWMISSSMVANGLAWWQSWLCVWIGYVISASFVCMTGRIGATYHISFPVTARASFGIWGSLWPVFNRAAMACVWYGVQAWIGGKDSQLHSHYMTFLSSTR